MEGKICNQCVHESICKFREASVEFERGVDELVAKLGKEVFFGHLDCRHKQKNPVVTGSNVAKPKAFADYSTIEGQRNGTEPW